MSVAWNFAFLVPNIAFGEAIGNEYLALVPGNDPRLVALAGKERGVRALVQGIKDQYGQEVEPSALLVRSDAPNEVDYYAILCFLNAITISAIIENCTLGLTSRTRWPALWTDHFDIYPTTVAVGDAELMTKSLAYQSLNTTAKFAGQIAPYLPPPGRLNVGIDEPIFHRLMFAWERRILRERPRREGRVLFRSLELACQAARLPTANRVATMHDVGLSIGQWVSAFEVLTHPKKGGANQWMVYDLLDKVDWQTPELANKRYVFSNKNKKGNKVKHKLTFIQMLYRKVYLARCNFLHGNEVSPKDLFPYGVEAAPLLNRCAILVFRAALPAYLPDVEEPGRSGKLAAGMIAIMNQRKFEKAVLACRDKLIK